MAFDHLLDDATSPADAAEAARIMAEATVDDPDASDQERADAAAIMALSWEELVAGFSASQQSGRHEAPKAKLWLGQPLEDFVSHTGKVATIAALRDHRFGTIFHPSAVGAEFDAALTDEDRAVLDQAGVIAPVLGVVNLRGVHTRDNEPDSDRS